MVFWTFCLSSRLGWWWCCRGIKKEKKIKGLYTVCHFMVSKLLFSARFCSSPWDCRQIFIRLTEARAWHKWRNKRSEARPALQPWRVLILCMPQCQNEKWMMKFYFVFWNVANCSLTQPRSLTPFSSLAESERGSAASKGFSCVPFLSLLVPSSGKENHQTRKETYFLSCSACPFSGTISHSQISRFATSTSWQRKKEGVYSSFFFFKLRWRGKWKRVAHRQVPPGPVGGLASLISQLDGAHGKANKSNFFGRNLRVGHH